MAIGGASLSDGNYADAAQTVAIAAVSLLKISPVLGNTLSAGSLIFDAAKTGVAIAKCHR